MKITYGVTTDTDTAVFRGRHWPWVAMDGANVPELEGGVARSRSFWWKCSAWRHAKKWAVEIAKQHPGAIVARA